MRQNQFKTIRCFILRKIYVMAHIYSGKYVVKSSNSDPTPSLHGVGRVRVCLPISRFLTVEVRWWSELVSAVDVVPHLQHLRAALQHLLKDILCDGCFLQDDNGLLVIELKRSKDVQVVKKGN